VVYRGQVPKRSDREPLTREDFAEAALRVIDERGMSALTTRALGEELGVHGTAVYRHFATMDDLVEAALARMLQTSGAEIPEHGTPRERLAGILRSLRRAFAAHPNFAIPNLTIQDEQATVDFVRAAIALLEEMGIEGRNLAVAYQLLETFHVGTTAYDWGGYPDALEARRRGRRLVGHPMFDDCSRSLDDMVALNDEVYEVGLEAVLDACEALASGS